MAEVWTRTVSCLWLAAYRSSVLLCGNLTTVPAPQNAAQRSQGLYDTMTCGEAGVEKPGRDMMEMEAVSRACDRTSNNGFEASCLSWSLNAPPWHDPRGHPSSPSYQQ